MFESLNVLPDRGWGGPESCIAAEIKSWKSAKGGKIEFKPFWNTLEKCELDLRGNSSDKLRISSQAAGTIPYRLPFGNGLAHSGEKA